MRCWRGKTTKQQNTRRGTCGHGGAHRGSSGGALWVWLWAQAPTTIEHERGQHPKQPAREEDGEVWFRALSRQRTSKCVREAIKIREARAQGARGLPSPTRQPRDSPPFEKMDVLEPIKCDVNEIGSRTRGSSKNRKTGRLTIFDDLVEGRRIPKSTEEKKKNSEEFRRWR